MRIILCLIISFFSVEGFISQAYAEGDHGHDTEAHEEEVPKGPHGGRYLIKDNFAVELTIFEKGVPPQFRAFAYQNEEEIDPKDIDLKVELHRFGGAVDTFELMPQGRYLTSSKVVEEPHSFEVNVKAAYKGKSYSWEYDSYEGRVEIDESARKVAAIGIDSVGPRTIRKTVEIYGKLIPQEDKVAHIHPRFSGIIKEIKKAVGQEVQRGEVLAVVESNQGLQPYEVRSQIAGIIISRHGSLGEFVSDQNELFVVADLSSLWAEFQIYRDDFDLASVGQALKVVVENGRDPLLARVSYVSPVTDETTQSKVIRAMIPNAESKLRPGLFITGELTVAENSVPLAIKRTGLQTFRDWNVVFLNEGDLFQAIPVELGKMDSDYVEVLSGVSEGQRYVSENSFIIKADIEKSGASHDH